MKLIDIVTVSRKVFFAFVDECNRSYRSGDDLSLYREIIDIHNNTKIEFSKKLCDELFVSKIHDTLLAWNMNQRGARLADKETIKNSISLIVGQLNDLNNYKLEPGFEMNGNVENLLKTVFLNLKIMESKRRIVGVSKAMHFILPNLIMPIDSKYTMDSFYGYNKYDNIPEREFKTFLNIFTRTITIVNRLNLTQDDVEGEKWNTSVPKLIDNAIIGCSRYIDAHDVSEVISLVSNK